MVRHRMNRVVRFEGVHGSGLRRRRSRGGILAWAALTAALWVAPTWAIDIDVPADYPTIQAAIDAANSGDTIHVQPGTYGPIDFGGKNLHVRSVAGPTDTIIDGAGQTVVHFENGETSDAILEGFTVRGAAFFFGSSGGGIVCVDSSPTIRGNIITENTGSFAGAGIYSTGGSPTIVDNVITQNAIAQIIADTTTGSGAGIYISGGNPTIEFNDIRGNGFAAAGGGLFLDSTNASLYGNRFVDNVASNGGAIYVGLDTVATIENCLFTANRALGSSGLLGPVGGRGGALRVDGISVEIFGCTITGNTATGSSSPIIPDSDPHGGAIELVGGLLSISHSILWANVSPFDPEIHDLVGQTTVEYTDISGGFAGVGNFDEDPLFAASGGNEFFLSQLAAGEPFQSPCVDAGNPAAPTPAGTTRTDLVADSGPADLGYHLIGAAGGFRRGDINDDASTDVSDVIYLLSALFVPGSPDPNCEDAADTNDDGGVDIADAVTLLNALFVPGSAPLPPPLSCGIDPTGDSLTCTSSACP